MWTYAPTLKKYLLINNADFDLIHFVDGCWRQASTYEPNILFEHDGAFYIVEGRINIDIEEIGVDLSYGNGGYRVKKIGDRWVLSESVKKVGLKWKKKDSTYYTPNTYELDLENNKWVPWPVAEDSDSLTSYKKNFERVGVEVYKSTTLIGAYEWQGVDTREDIIVGYRKYTHLGLDSEGEQTEQVVTVIESVGLTEYTAGNLWSYTYKGDTYTYTGDLPLESFTMESGDKELDMTYIELVELTKDIWNLDGGAQIVD